MADTKISTQTLRQRVEVLKKEVKQIYERRRFYGETGFRCSKLTDDLLRDTQQKEAMIEEYEALLQEAEK